VVRLRLLAARGDRGFVPWNAIVTALPAWVEHDLLAAVVERMGAELVWNLGESGQQQVIMLNRHP